MHVTDLQTGDEIRAYMRPGLALEVGRRADGRAYRFVPSKARKVRATGITRFQGVVISNDTAQGILTCTTAYPDHRGVTRPTQHPPLEASISYTAFRKILLLSKFSYEPRPELRYGGAGVRPTTQGLGTAYKPYRTLTQVDLR